MNTLDHILPVPEIDLKAARIFCRNLMLDLKCFELPVLKEGRLYGRISLEACVQSEDVEIENLVTPGCPYVFIGTHLFDIMRVLALSDQDICAVLSDENRLIGIISTQLAFNRMVNSISIEQAGATILVEMASYQYSSSELARIIESENAQLLGLWIENVPNSGRIRANLKVNTSNAERIVNSLLRFDYEVIATFGDIDYKEKVEKRYQSLMKYLDI